MHQHHKLVSMSSSISCCCGHSFTTSAALKNHLKGCDKNKKCLTNVLTQAKGLYNAKRHCISPVHSTSHGEGLYSELQDTKITSMAEIIKFEVWTYKSNGQPIDQLHWQGTTDPSQGSESMGSLPFQDDTLPLSVWWSWWDHRRLLKWFRDMLSEPPPLLPPFTDIFPPSSSTPTPSPSTELAHSFTETDPTSLPLSADTLVGQASGMRLHQVYWTQSNLLGLFCLYDEESLPVHDPEDMSDNVAGSWPPGVQMLLTTSTQLSNTETSFYPYPNKASLCLGDWYWNQGALKSKDSFRKLLNIIGSPSFRPDDIRNTKWALIDHFLGMLTTDEDLAQSTEWLDNNAGWICTTVTVTVPFSWWSANHGPKDYSVPDFYHHSLLSIIHERVLDPNDHYLFHYEPYELLWRCPRNNHDITVHGELFTSRSFLDAHCELLESPPMPKCTLPRCIIALMFWSDAMQLTSFGDAKLWPLYVFFGNQTKYRRGQPSAKLCSHVAYFQMVSCTKHVWYREHGTYCQFEIILEWVMSVTHIAVIPHTRTGPAYKEESMKTDYPDARNEYGTL